MWWKWQKNAQLVHWKNPHCFESQISIGQIIKRDLEVYTLYMIGLSGIVNPCSRPHLVGKGLVVVVVWITNVKSLTFFSFTLSFFHFSGCLNYLCLNMSSTWTGAPGCINDALLTGLEFVEGFKSYFFVSRWTFHQLVNSCS